jgi:hypothetical protein
MKKIALFLVAVAVTISADTTYIATTLGSLMNGTGRIRAGDTLLIKSGTYANVSNFTANRAGTAEKPIVVRGETPNSVFLNLSPAITIWYDIYEPYWIFENLVINGYGSVNHAFKLNASSDSGGRHSSYVQVRNCKFIDFSETPVKAGSYSVNTSGERIYFNEYWPGDYLIWENNECTGNKYGENGNGNGFNIDGSKNVVFRGNFYYNMLRNPTLWGSGQNYPTYSAFIKGGSYNCIFENNVFSNAGWGICVGGGCMDPRGFRYDNRIYEVKNSVYRNNVVKNCNEAVRKCGVFDSVWIYNNTFINSNSVGAVSGFFAINNLVMGQGASVTTSGTAVRLTNYTSTTYNPDLFWDPTHSNFALKPAAASVITTGTNLSGALLQSVNTDMLGTVRPSAPRIGAFEIYDTLPMMNDVGIIIPISVEEDSKFQNGALYNEAALSLIPNPANPTTIISFSLQKDRKDIELSIVDLTGRTVKNLFHGPMNAGKHVFKWSGETHVGVLAASGAYLVKLRTGLNQIVVRLNYVK